jgi:hypothetical protein
MINTNHVKHTSAIKWTLKNASLVVLSVFFLGAFPFTPSASAEICDDEALNGDFEDGDFGPGASPTHWIRSAWQPDAEFLWSDSASHSGAWSVQINNLVTNDSAWLQTLNLLPDTEYVLSGWVKTNNVSAGYGANLSLWGTWTRSTALQGTNDWTYVSIVFDSGPTGTVQIAARLGYWGGTSSGTAWFDQVSVKQLPPPAPAPNPNWKILVLIYDETDFYFVDGDGLTHHVVASMTEAEKTIAVQQSTRFFEEDVPALNSGNMTPTVTIRLPDHPLTSLSPDGVKWWPAPSDVAADLDPAFDSVIVIWDNRGQDLTTGMPIFLNRVAGLALHTGRSQTYAALYAQGVVTNDHRNLFKHEWGHSILFYFEAMGLSPLPIVTNHASVGQYVHSPTGDDYVWVDETDSNPIPNSIYHNTSGFTHDYYSGITATPDDPTRALGIPPSAWATGGPIATSVPAAVTSIVRSSPNPTNGPTVDFLVTFTKPVYCVDIADFVLDVSSVNGASFSTISGSGNTYTVTVNTGTGLGTLSVDLIDNDSIMDSWGNLLGGPGVNNGNFTAGEAYTVDTVPPTLSITPPSPTETNTGPVTYTVNYQGANFVTLSKNDIVLNSPGTASGTLTVSGSGNAQRTVTLSNITGDGTISLSVNAGTSSDLAGNFDAGKISNWNLAVDNTAPIVTVFSLLTSDSRPSLTGTINDPDAAVSITVDGQTLPAQNDGNSWTLPDNALSTLSAGTYDVQATATDTFGNVGMDATTAELTVQPIGASGGQITINLSPEDIVVGARLELTAPAGGTDYRWKGAGLFLSNTDRISGVHTRTLVIDPLALEDSCVYSCQYEDGVLRNIVETDGYVITVLAPINLPVTSNWILFSMLLSIVAIAAMGLYSNRTTIR